MSSTPRTFAHQPNLPRLPIPDLDETLQRYQKSLRPVLDPATLSTSTSHITSFRNGLGPVLQQRLKEHDKGEPNSWLERWWLRLAYHSWREGLMINSNWYMLARDLPAHPKDFLTREEDKAGKEFRGFTEFQINRAAGIVNNLLDYKELVDSETLPPEATKTGFLDMNQYRQMIGITRVPKPGCDINVGSHPAEGRHIVVLVRDQVYVAEVYEEGTWNRVSVADIEKQLKYIVGDITKKKIPQPAIPSFTGVHRDIWAEMHAHLKQLSVRNAESFFTIETALFAVCLDDYHLPSNIDYHARNVFHGRGGHNRWFDKAISVVVSADGKLGLNGEHSPCDALVPALMFDHCIKHEPAKDPPNAKQGATLRQPRLLEWHVDAKVEKGLAEAQKWLDQTIADSDVGLLHFGEFGADSIKKDAKVSPDAFMQMALQLTFYRLHNFCAAVYETASTRQFLHGRTETCRSLSEDSKNFVRLFQDEKASANDKYAALQNACTSHIEYLTAASNGKGVDRHLLGLRMCIKEGESAEIFKDPAYAQSSTWRLSTSGLFPGDRVLGTGFGAVAPDGYGMNYMLGGKVIKIGIESKNSCKETSTDAFRKMLAAALRDMIHVCREVNDQQQAKAKL
ncbi:hypothetical protein HK097_003759 [Rhizophlyctis rosea]|uniref:Choline/carnitine acyltransferase domain-containing protein n=1 Tax=Rhizophlyctis rosea TaxID=64517 RepID=A0AAD5SFB2_9FUNG|nr:hypothetical protein HK097_003759 [Rhizophlyctis rosea]